MIDKLSTLTDRAIAEGWAIDKMMRMVNRDLGEDDQPANEREVTVALRGLGYRVCEAGIRKMGEWAFSEETRENLLKLAADGAHMDELFEVADGVDDPCDFVEAQGFNFDEDDCCIAVKTATPKPKAATTPEARAKKKGKLSDDGLPNTIAVRLAGLDIRHVPGYPRVFVTADQVAFVRESSRRLGDHIRFLPRKRDPRTGRESWVLGMGARHKRVYLNIAKVMYNTGFWAPAKTRKKKAKFTTGAIV